MLHRGANPVEFTVRTYYRNAALGAPGSTTKTFTFFLNPARESIPMKYSATGTSLRNRDPPDLTENGPLMANLKEKVIHKTLSSIAWLPRSPDTQFPLSGNFYFGLGYVTRYSP